MVIKQLGRIPYLEALTLQESLQLAVQEGAEDHILILEHPKVITLGLNADQDNVIVPEDTLIARGFEIHHVKRGGDVTYHGPGQIMGYLLINLRKNHGASIKCFVHALEEALIQFLNAEYGLVAHRDPVNAGVFIGTEKICAIGLSVSKGVTMHGFALNINTELSDFDAIVPCGLKTRSVTSVSKALNQPIDFQEASKKLGEHLARAL